MAAKIKKKLKQSIKNMSLSTKLVLVLILFGALKYIHFPHIISMGLSFIVVFLGILVFVVSCFEFGVKKKKQIKEEEENLKKMTTEFKNRKKL